MKRRVFFIGCISLLMIVLSLGIALSATPPYNTDNAATNFTARVHIPIDVEANNTNADLGWIAPGTTKHITAETKYVKFIISGGRDWAFTASGTVTAQCNGATPDVFLDAITWQESTDDAAWYNVITDLNMSVTSGKYLNSSGRYYFRAYCTQLHAENTAYSDGTDDAAIRTFTATLTATYADM